VRPIVYGLLASFFFAFTFVLNRAMDVSGGHWIWSASLRYLFMVPFLLLIVMKRKNLGALLTHMHRHPGPWFIWSFIGFVLFYAPLSFAAAYGPGWLIAGTWQITIIAGSLLVPLFHERINTPHGPINVRGKLPVKGLLLSCVILLGVAVMQVEHAKSISQAELLLGILPVVLAAFAYPLGNRKMMEVCRGEIDAYQRVLGMTLASLPFWLLLAGYGWAIVGPASAGQTMQSIVVAISSGVIATVLFFAATDMVKGNASRLAAVEATQSGEVLFALLGEILLLSTSLPAFWSWAGMFLVVLGMILHSLYSHGPEPKKVAKNVPESVT
jgi:drug/metabolite transporter (DMT)-like permease